MEEPSGMTYVLLIGIPLACLALAVMFALIGGTNKVEPGTALAYQNVATSKAGAILKTDILIPGLHRSMQAGDEDVRLEDCTGLARRHVLVRERSAWLNLVRAPNEREHHGQRQTRQRYSYEEDVCHSARFFHVLLLAPKALRRRARKMLCPYEIFKWRIVPGGESRPSRYRR